MQYVLSFFDSLVSDLPAIPSTYDGNYSFSTVSGAYHLVGGVLEEEDGERYLYFCVKRASSTFVNIRPPYPIREVVQMTSRYARLWRGSPVGPPFVQGQVPDQYCHISIYDSGGDSTGLARFLNFSFQVYLDWVSFSGRVDGNEECLVRIEIKKIPEMIVVKNIQTYTENRRFYTSTHLEPGEYMYEAYAYPQQ